MNLATLLWFVRQQRHAYNVELLSEDGAINIAIYKRCQTGALQDELVWEKSIPWDAIEELVK